MVLPKRQLIITAELEEKVIGWYGLGLSTRDITKYVKEMQEEGYIGYYLIRHYR